MNIQNKIARLGSRDINAFAYAFILFLMTPPYFIWNKISPLFLIILCVIVSVRYIRFDSIPKVVFSFFLMLFFLFVGYKDGSNLFGYSALIGVILLTLIEDAFLRKTFKLYLYIYSITLIPSILSYLAVNLLGINLPYEIIQPLNLSKSYTYIQYPFYVQQNMFFDLILPRFHAYYDEPGVVGTVSGVLLMINKVDLRKKINYPVLFAGVFSFSFAFYMMILGYFFVFAKTKYKIIGVVVILSFLPIISTNELLNTYILTRLEINEDGSLSGDNRIMNKNFEEFYERYSKSDDFYFGLEKNASSKYNFGGASYKDLIVNYGIVPFCIFILILLLYAHNKLQFRKEFFIFLFILFSVIYQRPFITDYYYMFLIFAPIIFMSNVKPLKNKILHER